MIQETLFEQTRQDSSFLSQEDSKVFNMTWKNFSTCNTMSFTSWVIYLANEWSIRQEVFCKRVVLKNFAKFTVKHVCRYLFFKKSFRNRWFLWISLRFQRSPIFYKTPQVAAIEMTFLRLIPLLIIVLCCDKYYRPAIDLF